MAWLGTWANRRELTVAASDVDGNLTDFPVRVQLSNSAGKTSVDVTDIFDEVIDSWQKIAFTQSDGTTQLYAEVVNWVSIGEVAEIWVKVPSLLAASGGSIYMYYDSSQPDNTTYVGAVNSTAGANVWDSNFLVVYHFNETSGQYLDSTGNSTDSTTVSVNSRTRNGFFNANSPDFNEASDNYIFSPGATWAVSKTVEAFVLTDTVDAGYNPIVDHNSGTNWFQLSRNGSNCHWRWASSGAGSNYRFDFALGGLSTGTWYHIAGTLDQATTAAKGFIDGTNPTSTGTASLPSTASTGWYMGYRSSSEDWDGCLDEMRISNSARSNAWIAATNDTLRDNFTTWGAAEQGGYGNTVNTVSPVGKINTVSGSNITKVNGV